MLLQKGERETAQMQQCKAWWDEQAALAAQQRQQQLQEKQELAVTVKTLDAIQLSMKEQEGAIQAQLEAQVGRGAAPKYPASGCCSKSSGCGKCCVGCEPAMHEHPLHTQR